MLSERELELRERALGAAEWEVGGTERFRVDFGCNSETVDRIDLKPKNLEFSEHFRSRKVVLYFRGRLDPAKT